MKRFQIQSLESLINFINSLQVVNTDSRFRQIFINIFLIQLLVASTGFIIFEIILKKNTKTWQQSSPSVCLYVFLTHRHTHTHNVFLFQTQAQRTCDSERIQETHILNCRIVLTGLHVAQVTFAKGRIESVLS